MRRLRESAGVESEREVPACPTRTSKVAACSLKAETEHVDHDDVHFDTLEV